MKSWNSHEFVCDVSISVLFNLTKVSLLLLVAGALADGEFAHFLEVAYFFFCLLAVLLEQFFLVHEYVLAVLHLVEQVGSGFLGDLPVVLAEIQRFDDLGLVRVDAQQQHLFDARLPLFLDLADHLVLEGGDLGYKVLVLLAPLLQQLGHLRDFEGLAAFVGPGASGARA